MLRHYIKISLKVLLRNKFFTAISLFGISITLLILMMSTAVVYKVVSPGKPQSRLDRMLFLTDIKYTQKRGNSQIIGQSAASFPFLRRYVKSLQTPQLVSIYSYPANYDIYVHGKKYGIILKHADAEFWKIYDFEFIEGRMFSQFDVKNANHVAVISKKLKKIYFGDKPALAGMIEINDIRYQVIGVVENITSAGSNIFSDIWVPITTQKKDEDPISITGRFIAALLAARQEDIVKIKKEYARALQFVEFPDVTTNPADKDIIIGFLRTHKENLMIQYLSQPKFEEISDIVAYLKVAGILVLFILLPVLNLVNLNISRIMERLSEIGIRKAFGASKEVLVGQLLLENLILTFIGGGIGIFLTLIGLNLINNSGLFLSAHYTFSFPVFCFSFLICLIFGLISGAIPSYRISRLHPVAALNVEKGGRS